MPGSPLVFATTITIHVIFLVMVPQVRVLPMVQTLITLILPAQGTTGSVNGVANKVIAPNFVLAFNQVPNNNRLQTTPSILVFLIGFLTQGPYIMLHLMSIISPLMHPTTVLMKL